MKDSIPLGHYAVIPGVLKDVVFFLLGDSPVSEFYMAKFRNSVC
jgi:hypothetical protein